MKRAESTVSFQLLGGIGNQLFIYFAGQVFQRERLVPVVYDTTFLGQQHLAHNSSILRLSLDLKPHCSSMEYGPMWPMKNFSQSALAKIRPKNSQLFVSREVGYDRNLIATKAKSVRGYFQSWRHLPFTPQGSNCKRLKLNQESLQFSIAAKEIEECRALVVHVRRGDYLNFASTHGVLGGTYYREAILRAFTKIGTCPVIVVSDDEPAATELLSQHVPGLVTIPLSRFGRFSDEEQLVLMSFGRANVIANSTYSYMAAATNPDAEFVAYPSPWFFNLPEPLEICPRNWFGVQSHFWIGNDDDLLARN